MLIVHHHRRHRSGCPPSSPHIPLLARHFVELFAEEMNLEPPVITAAALQHLERYDFPGNVRELKNLVERSLIRSRGATIEVEHLQFDSEPAPAAAVGDDSLEIADLTMEQALEAAELRVVRQALEKSGGNVAAAARLLETNRQRIYRALERDKVGGDPTAVARHRRPHRRLAQSVSRDDMCPFV